MHGLSIDNKNERSSARTGFGHRTTDGQTLPLQVMNQRIMDGMQCSYPLEFIRDSLNKTGAFPKDQAKIWLAFLLFRLRTAVPPIKGSYWLVIKDYSRKCLSEKLNDSGIWFSSVR